MESPHLGSRFSAVFVALIALSGCQNRSLARGEVENQKNRVNQRADRVKDIAKDPVSEGAQAVDDAIDKRLRDQGVDGRANRSTP